MFYCNPKRLKELKEKGLKIKVMTLKEYNLTNNQKYGRGNNNEKIQNKTLRNGNTRSWNNIISKLSNS